MAEILKYDIRNKIITSLTTLPQHTIDALLKLEPTDKELARFLLYVNKTSVNNVPNMIGSLAYSFNHDLKLASETKDYKLLSLLLRPDKELFVEFFDNKELSQDEHKQITALLSAEYTAIINYITRAQAGSDITLAQCYKEHTGISPINSLHFIDCRQATKSVPRVYNQNIAALIITLSGDCLNPSTGEAICSKTQKLLKTRLAKELKMYNYHSKLKNTALQLTCNK